MGGKMCPPHDASDRQEFTAVLYHVKIIFFPQDVRIPLQFPATRMSVK
jgi:hypothetical protein